MEYNEFLEVVSTKSLVDKCVILSDDFITRGASGGNCWGGDARTFYTGIEYKGLPQIRSTLEDIVAEINIDVSFGRIIKVFEELKDLVYEEDWDRNEYYGNYTEGFRVALRVSDFYNTLKKWEVI